MEIFIKEDKLIFQNFGEVVLNQDLLVVYNQYSNVCRKLKQFQKELNAFEKFKFLKENLDLEHWQTKIKTYKQRKKIYEDFFKSYIIKNGFLF